MRRTVGGEAKGIDRALKFVADCSYEIQTTTTVGVMTAVQEPLESVETGVRVHSSAHDMTILFPVSLQQTTWSGVFGGILHHVGSRSCCAHLG